MAANKLSLFDEIDTLAGGGSNPIEKKEAKESDPWANEGSFQPVEVPARNVGESQPKRTSKEKQREDDIIADSAEGVEDLLPDGDSV